MPRKRQLALAVLATFSAPFSMAAVGQTAPAPTPATTTLPAVKVQGAGDNDFQVRTSENPFFTAPLLDTPKSVVIIPQAVIQQTNSISLTDALRTTSGITFGAAEGGNPVGDRPFIRGFDSQGSIFVDSVRDTGSQTRDTFAIEQIEVMKGPSSAFSGRGSVGGSINLISKLARPDNFTQGLLSVGTDAYVRGIVDSNYMFNSDKAAVRIAAMGYSVDVPGREAVYGDRWGIAPSITFGLKSDTKVMLSYYHLNDRGMPDYSTPYDPRTGQPVEVNRDNFYGLIDRDFRKGDTDIGTATITHDFGNKILFSNTTRYGRSTNDYIVTNPDDSTGNVILGSVWRNTKSRNSATTTLTNQTDITGEAIAYGFKHSFLVGLEFTRDQTYNNAYAVATGNRVCANNPVTSYNCTSLFTPNPSDPWQGSITAAPTSNTSTTNITSLYAFDTMEISAQWLVNLGLRFDDYRTTSNTPAYNTAAGVPVATVNLRNDSNFVNYQAGVVYKPVPQGSIYAMVGSSSLPPGISNGDGADNITVTNQSLDPVSATGYEIGVKWDFLGGALSFTGAVFYTDIDNARVQVDANTFANVGKQNIQGFEIGAAGAITDRWNVFGGYTFLKSELRNNGPFGTNPANNGNKFPNTPENSFSLWTTYQVLPALTVGGGAYYVDKQFGNVTNTRWIPSYWRFDAMAAYTINKNLSLQLNVQNLTDEKYWDQAYSNHYAHQAAAAQGVLTLNYRF